MRVHPIGRLLHLGLEPLIAQARKTCLVLADLLIHAGTVGLGQTCGLGDQDLGPALREHARLECGQRVGHFADQSLRQPDQPRSSVRRHSPGERDLRRDARVDLGSLGSPRPLLIALRRDEVSRDPGLRRLRGRLEVLQSAEQVDALGVT